MRFSQRIGITATEKTVQTDSMDDDLRNSLWNALTISYWDKFDRDKICYGSRVDYVAQSNLYSLVNNLWISSFKKPIDTIPTLFYDRGSRPGALGEIRNFFFVAEWYDVFNIIEDISNFERSWALNPEQNNAKAHRRQSSGAVIPKEKTVGV